MLKISYVPRTTFLMAVPARQTPGGKLYLRNRPRFRKNRCLVALKGDLH